MLRSFIKSPRVAAYLQHNSQQIINNVHSTRTFAKLEALLQHAAQLHHRDRCDIAPRGGIPTNGGAAAAAVDLQKTAACNRYLPHTQEVGGPVLLLLRHVLVADCHHSLFRLAHSPTTCDPR
jgi:hypothetical protein